MASRRSEPPITADLGQPTTKRTRKKQTRFTPKIASFIVDKLSEGMNISQICKNYPKRNLNPVTISRWRDAHPEFGKAVDEAYDSYFRVAVDKLEHVSLSPLAELYPELEGKDAYEQRRSAQYYYTNALKVADKLTKRWQQTSKVHNTGTNTGGIVYQVINYHAAPLLSNDKVKDAQVIDVDKDNS